MSAIASLMMILPDLRAASISALASFSPLAALMRSHCSQVKVSAGNSRSASWYDQLRNAPSVNFMMLPLCTIVTLLRLLAIAYWMAERNSRSVPSFEAGLMPMPEVSGKRILSYCFGKFCLSRSRKRRHSAVPASNSMPA